MRNPSELCNRFGNLKVTAEKNNNVILKQLSAVNEHNSANKGGKNAGLRLRRLFDLRQVKQIRYYEIGIRQHSHLI